MSQFFAGYSRVNITPESGTPLGGYYQARVAGSVLDELEINAMAVACDDQRAVVFAVDHLGLVQPVQSDYRKKIAEVTGLPEEAIYIHCLHIHNGPIVNLDGTDPRIEKYRLFLGEKLIECALAALADLKPAKLGFGVSHAPRISFIRRYMMKDGSVQTNPGIDNPNTDHVLGTVDDRVSVLRLDRENADSIVLAHFACHPDTVGGNDISADWPAQARRRVEKALDGVHCLVLNGAQGDVNHVNTSPAPGEGNGLAIGFDGVPRGYTHTVHMGNAVAGAVLQVYEKVEYVDVPSIRFDIVPFDVPSNMPSDEELPLARHIDELHSSGRDSELPYKDMMLTTKVAEAARILRLEHGPAFFTMPLTVLAIGPIAFIGIPGEPFTRVGLELKQAPGWKLVMPTCNTNAKEGYFPTRSAYDEGGYEAKASPFAPGVAEIIIEKGLLALNMLNDIPIIGA